MLGPLQSKLKSNLALDVEETGETYLDNAILKAKAAVELTNTWTIADDSGLEIDSLGITQVSFLRDLRTQMKKIEKILTALGDSPYRSAKVCSVMVLCTNSGEIIKNSIGDLLG